MKAVSADAVAAAAEDITKETVTSKYDLAKELLEEVEALLKDRAGFSALLMSCYFLPLVEVQAYVKSGTKEPALDTKHFRNINKIYSNLLVFMGDFKSTELVSKDNVEALEKKAFNAVLALAKRAIENSIDPNFKAVLPPSLSFYGAITIGEPFPLNQQAACYQLLSDSIELITTYLNTKSPGMKKLAP